MISGSPPLPLRIRASSRSAIEVTMSADATAVRRGTALGRRYAEPHALRVDHGRRLRQASVAIVRQGMPKQLLKVVGGRPAADRVRATRRCGSRRAGADLHRADYADLVATELPEVDPDNIPSVSRRGATCQRRGVARAVLAARYADAVIAVVTADQIMHPVDSFRSALVEGLEVVETHEDVLVTFGVVPTRRTRAMDICAVVSQSPVIPTFARSWSSRSSPTPHGGGLSGLR